MNVKEIRLGDLFVISNSKGVNANQVKFGGSYPYVTRTEKDNGIAGYIYADNLDKINPANTISFGQDTWTLFYQSEPYFTGNRVKILKLKDENFKLTEEVALYLITAMKKVLVGLTWGTSKNEVNFENRTICLPVTSSGEIDWQYMQERIAELEQERIAELEQERIAELEHYLVASGLNDYELTEDDKSILATELFNGDDATELPSENSCRKEARKFRVGDLFEVLKITNKLSKLKLSNDGKFPVYSSDTANNGIIGFTDTPNYMCSEDVPVYITFGDHTRSFNIVRKSFSVLDNVKILRPQFVAEDEILIYIITKWKKTIPDLGYSRHWKIAKDCVLFLPIQTDTANNPIIDPKNTYHPEGYIPDWSFMEKYIRAVEKVVIKDVVDWKDEEIKKAKELVS